MADEIAEGNAKRTSEELPAPDGASERAPRENEPIAKEPVPPATENEAPAVKAPSVKAREPEASAMAAPVAAPSESRAEAQAVTMGPQAVPNPVAPVMPPQPTPQRPRRVIDMRRPRPPLTEEERNRDRPWRLATKAQPQDAKDQSAPSKDQPSESTTAVAPGERSARKEGGSPRFPERDRRIQPRRGDFQQRGDQGARSRSREMPPREQRPHPDARGPRPQADDSRRPTSGESRSAQSDRQPRPEQKAAPTPPPQTAKVEPAPTPAKAPEPSSPPPQPTGWVKPITEHEIHPRKKPALTAKEALAQKARERAGKHPRKAAKPHRHTDAQQPEAQEGTAEPRGVAKPAEAARGTTKPREGLAALRRKGRRPAPTQTETALAPPPKPTLWQRILRFFGIGGK